MSMHTCETNVMELVSPYSVHIQSEVEKLAERYNLRIDQESSAIEVKVEPSVQALLGYTLWDEAGVIAIKGKVQLHGPNVSDDQPKPAVGFPVAVRFSLTYDPALDIELIKHRIEEYFGHDHAELYWNVSPVGHDDHAELSIHFRYDLKSPALCEYVRYVLGMITGRVLAA
jgi:hypothetical protein